MSLRPGRAGSTLLLLALLGSSGAARAQGLVPLDASPGHVDVLRGAQTLLVPAGGAGWPEVGASAFAPPEEGLVNLGLESRTWWGRFLLENPTTAPLERWLVVDHPTLDEIHLLEPGADGGVRERVCGLLFPATARELYRRTCAFRVVLAPGEQRLAYVSVQSQNELVVPIGLYSHEELVSRSYAPDTMRHVLWGLVLALALVNLFLFGFSRERVYLIYFVAVSLTLLWCVSLDGSIFLLVPGAYRAPRLPFLLFGYGSMSAGLVFLRFFLRLPEERPGLDRWVRWLPGLPVLAGLVHVAGVSWRAMNVLGLLLAVFIAVLCVVLGVVRWRDGHTSARYFTAAWSGYLLVYVLGNALLAGVWKASELLLMMPLAASAVECLLLALALADESHRRTKHVTRLQQASTRFVPFEFLRLLGHVELPEVRHGEQVARTMTVWFSDVRSFTTIVEGLSPAETMQLVNDYLVRVEPILTRNGGLIDKYIGDSIMALFESPDDALRAAAEAVAELARFNATAQRPIRIGVGLHTGPLVLGVVGSEQRLACTVLGDSVNLASRVEGLTRTYGVEVLCTEATVAALRSDHPWKLRELDRVQVKGKDQQVTIHQLLDAEPDGTTGGAERYAAGLAHYRAGRFAEAATAFALCLEGHPGDGAAALLLSRCSEFAATPPERWDGVLRLVQK